MNEGYSNGVSERKVALCKDYSWHDYKYKGIVVVTDVALNSKDPYAPWITSGWMHFAIPMEKIPLEIIHEVTVKRNSYIISTLAEETQQPQIEIKVN